MAYLHSKSDLWMEPEREGRWKVLQCQNMKYLKLVVVSPAYTCVSRNRHTHSSSLLFCPLQPSSARRSWWVLLYLLFHAKLRDSSLFNMITKWMWNIIPAAVSAALNPWETREKEELCLEHKDIGCRWRELPHGAWTTFESMSLKNTRS